MFSLTSGYSYYLYRHSVDMRKGFDGLSGLIEESFGRRPGHGEVYLFLNRCRNRMKLLRWEQGGFVLYYKRLESGTFRPWKQTGETSCYRIHYPELVLMVAGIEARELIWRKRYTG